MKPLKILLIAVFLLTCGCATTPQYDPNFLAVGYSWLSDNPGKTWEDFARYWQAQREPQMGGDPDKFLAFMGYFNQLRMLQEMQFQNQLLMIGPRPIRPYGFGYR